MTKRFISIGLGCFLMVVSALGYAQKDPWSESQELVKTLMDQESQRLLQQQEAGVVDETQWSNPHTPKSMRLKALYGVGAHTHVLVEYGGEDYLFLPGQQQANGQIADGQSLQLKEITGSCVELVYAEQAHTRCITPSLP